MTTTSLVVYTHRLGRRRCTSTSLVCSTRACRTVASEVLRWRIANDNAGHVVLAPDLVLRVHGLLRAAGRGQRCNTGTRHTHENQETHTAILKPGTAAICGVQGVAARCSVATVGHATYVGYVNGTRSDVLMMPFRSANTISPSISFMSCWHTGKVTDIRCARSPRWDQQQYITNTGREVNKTGTRTAQVWTEGWKNKEKGRHQARSVKSQRLGRPSSDATAAVITPHLSQRIFGVECHVSRR